MLKSNSSLKTSQGNIAKHLSYKEAWSQIKESQEQGFYLEAVTLEESIITDRLISYLVGIEAIQLTIELTKCPSFNELIQKWKKSHSDPINIKVKSQDYHDLQFAVNKWRIRRNKVVHGMVKSYPGKPTNNILDFLEEAKLIAKDGEFLARAVSYWVRKSKVNSAKHLKI